MDRNERGDFCYRIAMRLLASEASELRADEHSTTPDMYRMGARAAYNDLAERDGCPFWQELDGPDPAGAVYYEHPTPAGCANRIHRRGELSPPTAERGFCALFSSRAP